MALLYVDGEVDADGVTVDFATLAETDVEDFVGSDCEIAGWGYDESRRILRFFYPTEILQTLFSIFEHLIINCQAKAKNWQF